MEDSIGVSSNRVPWNKGKLIGQRPALKLKEVRAIRIRLQISKVRYSKGTFAIY